MIKDLLLPIREIQNSRKSSVSGVSNSSHRYLDELKNIQSKAKAIIRQNSLVNNFPSPPPLERHNVAEINATVDHLRVPILVPQSFIRKNNKLKPPMMNHITKSGEVMSIHLLNESTPIYDPLVKAEARILKNSLGSPDVLADIQYSGNPQNRLLKSISPVKRKSNSCDLTPPEGLHVIRENTPRDRVERYNFRESDSTETTNESSRTWVAERMKSYSKQIKALYRPQISTKKQVEIEMLKERQKRDKPVVNKRIKLLQIS